MTATMERSDIFGSVRRSLVFRGFDGGNADDGVTVGTLASKLGSCLRKSRVFSRLSPPRPSLPSVPNTDSGTSSIRWRKGEMIGCGAFGRVYMGMNSATGELLAVKQVLINGSNASKEKAQAHIRELEEEVKLLKNLSHPNIVRYLGTEREEDTLNIFLEFVPGGSISSLLGKFGSFPEPVIRTYTKQLLIGLEYLHNNGIMHRDIKGANILVDNKGGIKLADFGASKQVAELATISGAKSMKGTPYWMAPEVILQTGHNFSVDIWSVGCTIIEMATGKPPWSQQYQEVAAIFHIGSTKAHPPIPEHLTLEGRDFLQQCLQEEPKLRPTASELLQHPFVTGGRMDTPPPPPPFPTGTSASSSPFSSDLTGRVDDSMDMCELGSLRSSAALPKNSGAWRVEGCEDDMCEIGEAGDFSAGRMDSTNKSFNPVSEASGEWKSNLDEVTVSQDAANGHSGKPAVLSPSDPSLSEDEDEVTESKIKAFLDDKAWELKKLQTPLYEEYWNSMNGIYSPRPKKSGSSKCEPPPPALFLKLPPKSPNKIPTPVREPGDVDVAAIDSRESHEWEIPIDAPQDASSPGFAFSEKERRWKEELDQELQGKREMMRQTGIAARALSPNGRLTTPQRDRSRFASPGR